MFLGPITNPPVALRWQGMRQQAPGADTWHAAWRTKQLAFAIWCDLPFSGSSWGSPIICALSSFSTGRLCHFATSPILRHPVVNVNCSFKVSFSCGCMHCLSLHRFEDGNCHGRVLTQTWHHERFWPFRDLGQDRTRSCEPTIYDALCIWSDTMHFWDKIALEIFLSLPTCTSKCDHIEEIVGIGCLCSCFATSHKPSSYKLCSLFELRWATFAPFSKLNMVPKERAKLQHLAGEVVS